MAHLMKRSGKPCGKPDGHQGQCYSEEVYARRLESKRTRRAASRDEISAYSARYYAEHREEKLAYCASYRTENFDKVHAREARYRADNRDEINEAKRISQRALHDEAVALYGNRCACCGSDDYLEIDHVYGAGTRHVREMFNGQHYKFYRWLLDNHPAGFQILCGPCNSSKHGHNDACQLDHSLDVMAVASNNAEHPSTSCKA